MNIASTDNAPDLEAAAWFLEYDLRDSADSQRLRASGTIDDDPELAGLHEAAADRLEELADQVDEIPTALLVEYAEALEFERDGPTMIHCSMTLEIGFAIDPQDIVGVCHIYTRAVELVRHDPRFATGAHMVDLWMEFKNAGHG
jgi:hypothetical protein